MSLQLPEPDSVCSSQSPGNIIVKWQLQYSASLVDVGSLSTECPYITHFKMVWFIPLQTKTETESPFIVQQWQTTRRISMENSLNAWGMTKKCSLI